MNSRGGLDDRLVGWVIKTQESVSEWTSRVDNALYSRVRDRTGGWGRSNLGTDGKLFPCEIVTNTGT